MWSWRVFWLFLHILSAFIAFGPTFAYGVIGARGGAEPQHALFSTELIEFLTKRLTHPFAVLTAAFGVVLIFTADIDFLGSEWLLIASVLFVVALGFSVLVMTPNAKSMIEIMRSMPPGPPPAGGTGPPPELQRLIKRSQIGGMFLSVLFLAILVLMVWKPGAAFI